MDSDMTLKSKIQPAPLRYLAYVFAAFVLPLLYAGCMDAASLGSKAADHLVISGTPSWTNGIGKIMDTKCAVCHQVPRLPSSPQNVPADLDLRYEKTYGAIRAGEDIAAQISLGILRHTLDYGTGTYTPRVNISVSAMPLIFGTL